MSGAGPRQDQESYKEKMYWRELSLRRKVALLRLHGSFACCFCLTEP